MVVVAFDYCSEIRILVNYVKTINTGMYSSRLSATDIPPKGNDVVRSFS